MMTIKYTNLAAAITALVLLLPMYPDTAEAGVVVRSTVRGAAVGAAVGGIAKGSKGASKGAAIGAGVGAVSGAAVRHHRRYDYYY
jgi:hypothetical protein